MWSLLSWKYQVTILVGVGVLAAWAFDGGYALIYGVDIGILKEVSLATTFVGGVFTVGLNFLWQGLWSKFPALQARTFPDLNGKWTGTLVSTWRDPETGTAPAPISVTIIIRQSLFSTSVSLKTNESTSHSTRVVLESSHDSQRFRVWYTYNNDPKAQVRGRSSPHEGVAYLDLCPEFARGLLEGRYYTDRNTSGDINVSRIAGGPSAS